MARDIAQPRLTRPEEVGQDVRDVVSEMLRQRGMDDGPESVAAILGLPWRRDDGSMTEAEVLVIDDSTVSVPAVGNRALYVGTGKRRQVVDPEWLGWGEWVKHAACRGHDPELWVLMGSTLTMDNQVALAICQRCPVRRQCEAEAEAWGDSGVIRGGRPFANGAPWVSFGYADEAAAIRQFFIDRCVTGPGLSATSAELYGAWASWCADRGDQPCSKNAFSKALTRFGIESYRSGHDTRRWRGVQVAPTEDACRPITSAGSVRQATTNP